MPDNRNSPVLSLDLISQVSEGVQLSASQRQANLKTHVWWSVKDLIGEVRNEWIKLVDSVGEKSAVELVTKALVDPGSVKDKK